MFYKIIFFLILIFLFYSCDGSDNSRDIIIGAKIRKLADFSLNDMKSYEVTVKINGNKKFSTGCRIYDGKREESIKFSLNESRIYEFEFSGYANSNCESERLWVGSTEEFININDRNMVTIPIAKVGSFMLSPVRLPSKIAFAEPVFIDENRVLLSGGAPNIFKNMKKTHGEILCSEGGDTSCDSVEIKPDWACSYKNKKITSCRKKVSIQECMLQGFSEETCEDCLKLTDSHKFELNSSSYCSLEYCPINKEGSCTMNASMYLQVIDLNNLFNSSFLKDGNGKNLSMKEGRILHETITLNDMSLFVGGAGLVFLSKNAPYILPQRTEERILMDYYDGNTIKSLNITNLNPSVYTDFNVYKYDANNFFLLNGRITEMLSPNTLFKKIIKCTTSSERVVDCKFIELENEYAVAGAGYLKKENSNIAQLFGGVYQGTDNEVFLNFENDEFKVKHRSINNLDYLYRPKVFNAGNGRIAIMGGIKFYLSGRNISFENEADSDFNNSVLYYYDNEITRINFDESNPFYNTVLSSVIPYSFDCDRDGEDENGILISGGLKFKDGKFKVIDSVKFFSFEDDSFYDLLTANEAPHLEIPRFGHTMVVDKYNRVWVMGGLVPVIDNGVLKYDEFMIDNTIEVFAPKIFPKTEN